MSKTYKVTYKTYFNERLKEVVFHGKLTYPLYVQVTFDRNNIVFKSYYFELFSQSRYAISMEGRMRGPSLEDIRKMENELIEYVIDKTLSDFSLDRFKQNYAFYSKDLCDVTEDGFIDYLHTFFSDKGMPYLATAVKQGSRSQIGYNVVQDMKLALKKELYEELIENSFYYAPPYLPLYGFMKQLKKWPLLSLSIMEWEDIKIQARFVTYFTKNYPNNDPNEMLDQIGKWLGHFKKQVS